MTDKQSGMTLVEVMISVVVLSMIMLGLVTAMRTLSNSYERVQAVHGRSTAFREVSTFLRHSIREAVDVGVDSFKATSSEIIWMAPLDRIGTAGGVLWMRLVARDQKLMMDFAKPASGTQPATGDLELLEWGAQIPSQILLEGLEGLSVSTRLEEDGSWQPYSDEEASGLPHSVMVDWKFREVRWPPLIIAFDNYRGTVQ